MSALAVRCRNASNFIPTNTLTPQLVPVSTTGGITSTSLRRRAVRDTELKALMALKQITIASGHRFTVSFGTHSGSSLMWQLRIAPVVDAIQIVKIRQPEFATMEPMSNEGNEHADGTISVRESAARRKESEDGAAVEKPPRARQVTKARDSQATAWTLTCPFSLVVSTLCQSKVQEEPHRRFDERGAGGFRPELDSLFLSVGYARGVFPS